MVREYELMYIVRPDVDDDGLRQAADSVEELITGLGGEIEKTTMWGKRRLAYEVKHLRDGHYVVSHLKLDGQSIKEVERALRIHDTVFRHLLVTRDGVGELGGEDRLRGTDAEIANAPEAGAEAETAPAAGPKPDEITDSDGVDDDAEQEEE
ncbi:MAG: 30S ribosomal protein S6 [Candidatus Dormibacteria bacterium]